MNGSVDDGEWHRSHRCLMLDVCGGASVVIICDQERAIDISD